MKAFTRGQAVTVECDGRAVEATVKYPSGVSIGVLTSDGKILWRYPEMINTPGSRR